MESKPLWRVETNGLLDSTLEDEQNTKFVYSRMTYKHEAIK